MTHPETDSRNDLESRSPATQSGRTECKHFMRQSRSSQIFIPVKDSGKGIANWHAAPRARALSLTAMDCTNQRALFPAPESATPIVDSSPDLQGSSLEGLRRKLMPLVGGYGIAIHLDSNPGLDLEPGTVPAQSADAQQTR